MTYMTRSAAARRLLDDAPKAPVVQRKTRKPKCAPRKARAEEEETPTKKPHQDEEEEPLHPKLVAALDVVNRARKEAAIEQLETVVEKVVRKHLSPPTSRWSGLSLSWLQIIFVLVLLGWAVCDWYPAYTFYEERMETNKGASCINSTSTDIQALCAKATRHLGSPFHTRFRDAIADDAAIIIKGFIASVSGTALFCHMWQYVFPTVPIEAPKV